MTTPPTEEAIIQLPLNQSKAMVITWALTLSYAQFTSKIDMQLVAGNQLHVAIQALGYDGFKGLLEDLNRLMDAAFPGIETRDINNLDTCEHCSCDPGTDCCFCGRPIPSPLS